MSGSSIARWITFRPAVSRPRGVERLDSGHPTFPPGTDGPFEAAGRVPTVLKGEEWWIFAPPQLGRRGEGAERGSGAGRKRIGKCWQVGARRPRSRMEGGGIDETTAHDAG